MRIKDLLMDLYFKLPSQGPRIDWASDILLLVQGLVLLSVLPDGSYKSKTISAARHLITRFPSEVKGMSIRSNKSITWSSNDEINYRFPRYLSPINLNGTIVASATISTWPNICLLGWLIFSIILTSTISIYITFTKFKITVVFWFIITMTV